MASNVSISPVDMKTRASLGLRAGDTVRVWQKIEEIKISKGKNKKDVATRNVRRQAFEGLVLAVKHGSESGGTFTVRRVASGVGVERIFPIYSPMIDEVEVLRRARTRRAKLYFIRRKASKDAKRAVRKQIALDTRGSRTDTKQAEEAAATPQEETVAVE